AKDAGLHVKINAVALKGVNDDEFHRMVEWCGERGFDLTFIEVMPLGELDEVSRLDQYIPLTQVRSELETRWTLEDTDYRTGGPARYMRVKETGCRVGFITPLTHSFCESCNRVRLTCTGMLCLCLGQEDAVDLRTPLRTSDSEGALVEAMRAAIGRKPRGHDFAVGRPGTVRRFINVTGG
ncbi:MAG TPA: GTP 3',8-cyclase MoaA, partial [Azospirillum sp.]|nr:GTP 3',8-cyclase MoaA [Azospirillum sp.]